MIRWPFVSRARFADLERRCVELEAERRALLDRLLVSATGAPIFAKPEAPAAETEQEEKPKKEEMPPARRLTAKDVIRFAERDRNYKAGA